MPTQVDTGYGVITFDDQMNFSGTVGGVRVNGNVDESGTGSVYADYQGTAGAYYFEGGSLVGYPDLTSDYGLPSGGFESDYGVPNRGYESNDGVPPGRFGWDLDVGPEPGYGLPPAGDGGAPDWFSDRTNFDFDHEGVRGGISGTIDVGLPVLLEGSAQAEFNWSEREINLEVSLELRGSDGYLNNLINPEGRPEGEFVRGLYDTATDQVWNAVENLGTNVVGFYSRTAENIGDLRDNITNFHDNAWQEIRDGIDQVFAL